MRSSIGELPWFRRSQQKVLGFEDKFVSFFPKVYRNIIEFVGFRPLEITARCALS